MGLNIDHRLKFSENTRSFITFIGGFIISTAISSLLGNLISPSEFILILLIIIVVLSAVYFFIKSDRSIRELADSAKTTVKFMEELYRKDILFKGLVYEELTKHIKEADEELICVSSPFKAKESLTLNHDKRDQYLHAIEYIVRQKKEKDFKYLRIQQIPSELKDANLADYLGEVTTGHYRRILELEQQIFRESTEPKLTIRVMKMTTHTPTSFVIIDKKIIAIEVVGYHDDKHYTSGMIIFEDRDKNHTFAGNFLRLYENLEQYTQPIKPADLK